MSEWPVTSLASIAYRLSSALSREALYRAIAESVSELFGVSSFALFELDDPPHLGRLLHIAGELADHEDLQAARFLQHHLREVATSLEPIVTEGNVLVPLHFAGTRGALVLASKNPASVIGTNIVREFALLVAVALRNATYVASLDERANRLIALSEAQQRLTRVTDQDSLAPAIADAVAAVLPGRDCDVFFTSPNGLSRVYSMRGGESVKATQLPDEELELMRATFQGGLPRMAARTVPPNEVARASTEICAPIQVGDRPVGVVRVLAPASDTFELQDLDLLTILARHVGTAFETVRLFTAQDLQRRRAEAGAEIARAALDSVNLRDGISRLLRVLDRAVPSDGKAIGIARTREAALEFIGAVGTLTPLREQRLASSGSLASLTRENRATEYESLKTVAPPELAALAPDEWSYVIPLGARDRAMGVLIVSTPQRAPLERSARTTLDRLTASLALALDALLLDEEEQQAREREQLLATALTTINHPIFILEDGAIRYANPAAAREYGWAQQDLVGRYFADFVAGIKERESHAVADAIMERGISLAEHVHRRSDGSEFPAAVTVSEFNSGADARAGQVVSIRNMTTERAFAEQLRHTEKMVALGELVAGVAHEINNPLTGISAFAQLLLEETLTPEQHESVELIKRESDRATAVIRDLLIFARKAEPVTGPVDVNNLLEQTLRLRAYQLRNSGIETHVELDPSSPRLRGDPQKLQQVLLNIITNAEHAMRDAGRKKLSLRTMRHRDRVIIEAADTGHGMASEIRRRVFEPFYTTKPAGVGTGLGLSVSYGIVQAHGGEIDVHSEPGVGTTVVLSLPSADTGVRFGEPRALARNGASE